MRVTLDDLRRFAVARSLFPPTTLGRAIERLGFVQADPIRAPARAQDLTLRHRVRGYRAGDLERRYPALGIEEDFFVNYGFVTREVHALMHPRTRGVARSATQRKRTSALLAFVRDRGTVHPRDLDAHFDHGVVKHWGASSSATTRLLDDMHYRGLLRVARRDGGIRLYAVSALGAGGPGGQDGPPTPEALPRADRDARLDALLDATVAKYAPVPSATLSWLANRLRLAAPQWRVHVKPALARARRRLAHAHVAGVDWYWPADEPIPRRAPEPLVRLLAPFDPVVWDRRRFELLWGWPYRFEAYTPAAKRKLGYYALPVLWGDRAIGWANVAVKNGALAPAFGYAGPRPDDPVFARELDAELTRLRAFLGLGPAAS